MDFESLKLLCAAASCARIQMMGLYTSGPFTRVSFSLRRDEIVLRPDTAGVSVYCIQNEV